MLSDLSNINLRDGSSIRFAESWERADSREAGDVIKYDDQNINIQRSKNTRLYDSWRNAQMSFKNASLQSIINTINNSYELEVVLENTKLKERKITATVKQNDPRLLLKAISTIYDIQITEKDNKIILK